MTLKNDVCKKEQKWGISRIRHTRAVNGIVIAKALTSYEIAKPKIRIAILLLKVIFDNRGVVSIFNSNGRL